MCHLSELGGGRQQAGQLYLPSREVILHKATPPSAKQHASPMFTALADLNTITLTGSLGSRALTVSLNDTVCGDISAQRTRQLQNARSTCSNGHRSLKLKREQIHDSTILTDSQVTSITAKNKKAKPHPFRQLCDHLPKAWIIPQSIYTRALHIPVVQLQNTHSIQLAKGNCKTSEVCPSG